mmetsp:Transcript_18621/g.18714  ORF Transcript_18621/g.18714 Transcript_18621/m.18714 type:complete len:193 (+) Transcript_18621:166-744(+)|eukprot:CAMPEP_0182427212 /NCGR_PEP_ID=MMETSP1167-20130531/15863_1 /TAXON_ID=2988 /ORGANISM="Mallomonas Sp, Strain CCMP3275" /LENGTH=192 /DNA_ID=CAMNT_0024609283 /DNA_START=164 /DNA_END=742 /DNA_ORIENTATION=+
MDSIFGLVGKGFVIIAADASAKRSIIVYKQDDDKIMELDSHKLLAGAGPQADCSNFSEFIQKNFKLYELNNDLKLDTQASAAYIRNELAQALRKGPYQTNMLLAGYDDDTGASLYFMDYLAAQAKIDYAAQGYAAYFTLSVMDRSWKPNMDEAAAVAVIKQCIHELQTRFMISQPQFYVKIVDKNGTRTISL